MIDTPPQQRVICASDDLDITQVHGELVRAVLSQVALLLRSFIGPEKIIQEIPCHSRWGLGCARDWCLVQGIALTFSSKRTSRCEKGSFGAVLVCCTEMRHPLPNPRVQKSNPHELTVF